MTTLPISLILDVFSYIKEEKRPWEFGALQQGHLEILWELEKYWEKVSSEF